MAFKFTPSCCCLCNCDDLPISECVYSGVLSDGTIRTIQNMDFRIHNTTLPFIFKGLWTSDPNLYLSDSTDIVYLLKLFIGAWSGYIDYIKPRKYSNTWIYNIDPTTGKVIGIDNTILSPYYDYVVELRSDCPSKGQFSCNTGRSGFDARLNIFLECKRECSGEVYGPVDGNCLEDISGEPCDAGYIYDVRTLDFCELSITYKNVVINFQDLGSAIRINPLHGYHIAPNVRVGFNAEGDTYKPIVDKNYKIVGAEDLTFTNGYERSLYMPCLKRVYLYSRLFMIDILPSSVDNEEEVVNTSEWRETTWGGEIPFEERKLIGYYSAVSLTRTYHFNEQSGIIKIIKDYFVNDRLLSNVNIRWKFIKKAADCEPVWHSFFHKRPSRTYYSEYDKPLAHSYKTSFNRRESIYFNDTHYYILNKYGGNGILETALDREDILYDTFYENNNTETVFTEEHDTVPDSVDTKIGAFDIIAKYSGVVWTVGDSINQHNDVINLALDSIKSVRRNGACVLFHLQWYQYQWDDRSYDQEET